jgi:hypothetical protein
MRFCDDIWNEIKHYVFHRHLWYSVERSKYNEVLKELPHIGQNVNFIPFIIHKSSQDHKYIKEMDLLSCNGNIWIQIESYVCVTCDYDMHIMGMKLINRLPLWYGTGV